MPVSKKFAHEAMVANIAVERDFNFCGAEYPALFARSDATAFQHPLWLDRFYTRLAPARSAEKLVVTGREAETGRLLFVLPMIRRHKCGITLVESADLGVSDYADPVIARSWRPSPELVGSVRDKLPPFDLLRIRPVRQECVDRWQIFFDVEAERQDFSAHAAKLLNPYPDWRSRALAPSFARYLDRKKKRFLKSGRTELRLLTEPIEIAVAFDAIQSLRGGRFRGDPIQQDFVRDFYADVAARGVSERLARTYGLMLDDKPIAYVFGISHGGRFHYLLIGCDYETYGRHSPGLIMYDLMIEDWIGSGGDCFDFTIGDEPFKKDFGTKPTMIYALSHSATRRGRLAAAALELRKHLRRPAPSENRT